MCVHGAIEHTSAFATQEPIESVGGLEELGFLPGWGCNVERVRESFQLLLDIVQVGKGLWAYALGANSNIDCYRLRVPDNACLSRSRSKTVCEMMVHSVWGGIASLSLQCAISWTLQPTLALIFACLHFSCTCTQAHYATDGCMHGHFLPPRAP